MIKCSRERLLRKREIENCDNYSIVTVSSISECLSFSSSPSPSPSPPSSSLSLTYTSIAFEGKRSNIKKSAISLVREIGPKLLFISSPSFSPPSSLPVSLNRVGGGYPAFLSWFQRQYYVWRDGIGEGKIGSGSDVKEKEEGKGKEEEE